MKTKILLFILIMVICIGGIQIIDKFNKPTSKEVDKPNISEESNYEPNPKEALSNTFGFGIESEQSLTTDHLTYRVNNKFFSPTATIENLFDKKQSFRIFALNNFEQTSINYNNKKQNFIDLELNPSEKKKINLHISLKKKLNDIIFVVVRNPEEGHKKNEVIGFGGNFLVSRALVESKDIPPLGLDNFSENNITVNKGIENSNFSFISEKKPIDIIKEQTWDVDLSKLKEIFVNIPVIKNSSDVFVFLDSEGVCSNPYFYKANENGMASINVQRKALTCSGPTTLFSVSNPLKNINSSNIDKIDKELNEQISNRINIKAN